MQPEKVPMSKDCESTGSPDSSLLCPKSVLRLFHGTAPNSRVVDRFREVVSLSGISHAD